MITIQQLLPLLVCDVKRILMLFDLVDQDLHLLLLQILFFEFHCMVLKVFFDIVNLKLLCFQLLDG